MDGTTPLTRSLPDTSDDTKGFLTLEDDDGEVITFFEPESIGSIVLMSESGIKSHIFSSSQTTSTIEGLAFVSSSPLVYSLD